MDSIFNRIAQIASKYGFKSVNEFGIKGLGYSSSEKLNRIRREGSKPSFEVLLNIAENFPEISMNWLITGKGELELSKNVCDTPQEIDHILPDSDFKKTGTPLFILDKKNNITNLFAHINSTQAVDFITLPLDVNCDGALEATNFNMYPKVNKGDFVLFKIVKDPLENILFGSLYIIGLTTNNEEHILLRHIHQSEQGHDWLKLVGVGNHQHPQNIKADRISCLGQVKAIISQNIDQ